MRRLLIALALALVAVPAAGAHPLGNFTVNQYARIQVEAAGVQVRFVLDQAEIPTLQLVQARDTDGSGAIDGAEVAAARDALVRDVTAAVSLTVGGRPVPLVVDTAALRFPPGQGGLATSRLDLGLRTAGLRLSGTPQQIAYTSTYAADRVGWKEVVVARASGTAVTATTAAAVDRTDGLLSYPEDVLASPAAQLSATVDARLGDGGLAVGVVQTDGNVAAADAGRDRSRLDSLIDPDRPLTIGFVLAALLVAMGWGALHALTPGHGKTMVAAYLAGSRGTARHAFALGATVTVAHTATVFALGFVTLTLSEFILPEQLYPWLNLVSGVLVLALGLAAIRQRARAVRQGRAAARAAEHAHDRGHGHDHGHDHGHAHDHDHGEHGHSHAPPDRLSWRSLLALGVSGGMIPCPSALVLLLGAIALDRTAFGVVLVCAFSLGLAGVVSGIGLAVLYARRLFTRIPSSGRAIRGLPVASAAVITILGLVLTLRALPGLA